MQSNEMNKNESYYMNHQLPYLSFTYQLIIIIIFLSDTIS